MCKIYVQVITKEINIHNLHANTIAKKKIFVF